MVKINRHGRICSLLTNASWLPKLDAAGSIPVSRSSLSQNALPRLTSFAKHTYKIGAKLSGFRLPFRDLTLDVFLEVGSHPMTLLVGNDLGVCFPPFVQRGV